MYKMPIKWYYLYTIKNVFQRNIQIMVKEITEFFWWIEDNCLILQPES